MTHVFPGMGATREMYSGPWLHLPNACFHNWPKNFTGTTVEDLARQIVIEQRIQANDILIGSSLGGIIACEIANQLPIKRLILIGSATHKDEVNTLLNVLHPLIDFSPLKLIQSLSSSIPHELSTMFAATDSAFINTLSKAIFQWHGLKAKVPTTRIHGKNDHVIPLPNRVDHIIDGGHLIAMSHAQECVDAIGGTAPN